jgi:hypothetical protein
MAEIAYDTLEAHGALSRRYLWEEMGDDDTGAPVLTSERADGTFQVVGTFGGATVALEWSNDGTNWITATDAQGNDVSFTAAGGAMFVERGWKLRASTSGGSGTDVDAYLLLGR